MTTNPPSNNSYIFDPESPAELARLIDWDSATTRNMGGPLTGIAHPETFSSVLDLACGPGSWVLDVAFEYPSVEVVGVDISRGMVDYAKARARSQGLDNASFAVMDITKPLNFSDSTFDLVNARFIATVLHRDMWEPLIEECTRILRPGGILRLTEAIEYATTSPSHARLNALLLQAMHRMGKGFSTDGTSFNVPTVLPRLLRKAEYQNIHYQTHSLEFSAKTQEWAKGYHSIEVIGHLAQSLFTHLHLLTQEEAQQLAQQACLEAQGDDFCAMQHYMTVWGNKPIA